MASADIRAVPGPCSDDVNGDSLLDGYARKGVAPGIEADQFGWDPSKRRWAKLPVAQSASKTGRIWLS